jgi:hypothetical protein
MVFEFKEEIVIFLSDSNNNADANLGDTVLFRHWPIW